MFGSSLLAHDTALVLAVKNMEIVRDCTMDKGQEQLFGEFYKAAKAAIEAFMIQHDWMQRRMNPTANWKEEIMPQQQEQDVMQNIKRNFNIAFNLCVMHQRALIVPLRNKFGVEALGTSCLFALIIMVLWVTFSRDNFMWYYTGIWLVFFAHRRVQSLMLARTGRMHSLYDGWPVDAIKFLRNENAAKLVGEPVIVRMIGYATLWFYQQQGWDPRGLPHFLLLGCFALSMVEGVKQTAWKRRMQGMANARIDQEATMRDFNREWGE